MSQEPIIAQCRRPLKGGEELVARLPGMWIQPGHYPFDFYFEPTKSRVEVKFRNPNENFNNGVFGGSMTIQFLWPNIAKCEFDRLILTGLYFDEWYIFCVPEIIAKSRLMTKSTGGTISYNVTAVNPGWRQQRLEQYQVTLEQLHASCSKGAL